MNQQQTEILERLLHKTMHERNREELALGWLRYETLRKLTPWTYAELNKENLVHGRAFGDLVDEMIIKPE